jgi:integrase
MPRESPKIIRAPKTETEPNSAKGTTEGTLVAHTPLKNLYGTRGAIRDKEIVRFGKYRATIYRRGDVANSNYFLRFYLKDEGRYFRKSLQTQNRKQAIDLATTELVNLLSKVESGQRILAISLGDLRRRFALDQEKQVLNGDMAANTQRQHHYRIENGLHFLKEKLKKDSVLETRVSAIDGNIFRDYLDWRLVRAHAAKHSLRKDVVRDELLTIRKMFLYAKKEKLCTERNIPNWDFQVEKSAPARERMTQRNYTDVINTLRGWVTEAKTEREIYIRRMLQHFILLIANTGMRSGEAFGLRNSDIEIHREAEECVINIRPETSKVRRGRKIVLLASSGRRLGQKRTTRINYLIRWIDKYQRHKKPSDLAFATFENKGRTKAKATDVIYKGYGALRKRLNDIQLGWFDPYHCRHFYITNRLLAGEPIHIVAKVCGTSVKEIEATYSHVLTEMASRSFGNRDVFYNKEGGYDVVEKSKRDETVKATKSVTRATNV